MSPNPSTHAPDEAASRLARGDSAPGETAAADERTRGHLSSPTTGRLGLIDYILLALIALGVVITVVMAIVNP